ncbi:MAG: flagellin [Desulfobacteraceae bacterium 4572_187]|nr:MAG: flagellin [Desulfobacteraceae bacterium 4572_187]
MAITLTSGMRQNLFALQNTSKLMEMTQNRLSTGKRVNTALDDPINFFAAENHQQRADDLSFRKDAMGEAVQTIKAGNNGIEAISDLIASAKSTAQSALSTTSTTERAALATQFNTLMDQVDDLAEDAGYKGINFLSNDSLTVTFNADGTNSIGLTGFDACSGALGVADATGSWATAANINTAITNLDSAKDTLRTESKEMNNNLSIITAREDFTEKMINTLEDGVANLTNADMNEEGANMLMLQTRQALGTTSLSLASEAAQSVLRLF